MNVIIITGASSGIGMEFAIQMDRYFEKVDEFWLVARSRDKLEETAKILRHKTRVFAMDVTDRAKLGELERELAARKAVVRILVNCAGYGLIGPFAEIDREQTLGMIRLNCEALTDVTKRLIPFMKKNSRIIQMASSAAFLPQPNFAVYAATKAYVLSFSRALGSELRSKGIYVTSVCPGPVDTPFFDIAEKYGAMLSVKKYAMANVGKVVRLALKDSCRKRSMSVYGPLIKAFRAAAKAVPHGWILRVIAILLKALATSN